MRKTIFILGFISIGVILFGAYSPREELGVVATMVVPDTTIFLDTDWHVIDAGFDNMFIGGFQFTADPAIQYIHDEPHYFRTEANTSFSCNTNNVTAWIGLRKNGTLIDSMETFCKNRNQAYRLYDFSVAELEPDDKLQLVHRVNTACTLIRSSYKTATTRCD